MLQNIPTLVIGGPLGAGKTSMIKHLLANKPSGERWAVLINEFGQVGLDTALLTTAADGIAIGEVAGGCVCCVNGVPFQIGLSRLLRKAKPDRLLIEPSGLGHPAQLMAQLRQPPWLGVLEVLPGVIVLDAAGLAAGKTIPSSQQEAMGEAGLLIMNKSESLDEQTRLAVSRRFPEHSLVWTHHGQIPAEQLTGFLQAAGGTVSTPDLAEGVKPLKAAWLAPDQPLTFIQSAAEGWSVGWRWHPSCRFNLNRLQHWLQAEDCLRAKMVVRDERGWFSANVVGKTPLEWRPSEWRQDSRLEMIFSTEQDVTRLQQHFAACRL